jgi:hypothetical protein
MNTEFWKNDFIKINLMHKNRTSLLNIEHFLFLAISFENVKFASNFSSIHE